MKETNETVQPEVTENSTPAESTPTESIPKVPVDVPKETPNVNQATEPAVSIPKSLWLRIKKAGLTEKFYKTDAISRLFMGDEVTDIMDELARIESGN